MEIWLTTMVESWFFFIANGPFFVDMIFFVKIEYYTFIIATFSSQDEGDSTSQVKYTSSHNHGSQNLDPSNSTVVTFQISRHVPLKKHGFWEVSGIRELVMVSEPWTSKSENSPGRAWETQMVFPADLPQLCHFFCSKHYIWDVFTNL